MTQETLNEAIFLSTAISRWEKDIEMIKDVIYRPTIYEIILHNTGSNDAERILYPSVDCMKSFAQQYLAYAEGNLAKAKQELEKL